MDEKIRIDLLLAQKMSFSREFVKEQIKKGFVKVDGVVVLKPSEKVSMNANVVCQQAPKYVGRGGLKLEKAIAYFNLDLENAVCLDIGASTGGFTDCMLMNGAQKVYAIDTGTGQLAPKLVDDTRVVNLEKTNVLNVQKNDFDLGLDCSFASVDVSFVSVTKILPSVVSLLSEDGHAVLLVKPQFEAGRENINKNGIVRKSKVHLQVLERVFECTNQLGLNVQGITYSPITGGDGNIEYLMYVSAPRQGISHVEFTQAIKTVVSEAFEIL